MAVQGNVKQVSTSVIKRKFSPYISNAGGVKENVDNAIVISKNIRAGVSLIGSVN